MIDQLTVFLTNTKGRLTAVCRTMGDAHIQMHALVVADTSDYGIVRIVCDNPERALKALKDANFSATLAKVVAVEVPNIPGGLSQVFGALDKEGLSIEYSYCFTDESGQAAVVMKTDEKAVSVLENAGFKVLHPNDLYAA